MADSLPALRAAFDGRNDLLALSLADVGDRLADEEAADLLLELGDHVGVGSLGALVESDEAARLLLRGLVAPSRQRLLAALTRLARTTPAHVWRSAPEPSPGVEPPPPTKPALQAWLKKHGIEEWLGAPARQVRPFLQVTLFAEANDSLVTVEDLLEGRGPTSRVARGLTTAYENAARTFLRYRAIRAGKAREREELWNDRPTEPTLRALSVRLHEAMRTLDSEATEAPVFLAGTERLGVVLEPPGVSMRFRDGTKLLEVTLGFSGYEEGPIRLDLSHGGPPERSPHVRAVLEWTLDAVHDPKHALHGTLAHALSQPTWTRFVDALAASLELPKEAEDDRRLVWRLDPADAPGALPALAPSIQKRTGKSGRWTSGAATKADKVEPELAQEGDRPVLDTLTGLDGLDFATRERRLAHALRLLVGHPRVFAEKSRVHVRETVPTLALVPSDPAEPQRGLRLVVRVGETEVPPHTVAREELLASYEGDVLFLAPVDPRVARMARALESFPAFLPTAAHDRVLTLLPRLQPAAELAMPSSLRGERVDADSTIVARLVPDDDTLTLSFRVRPLPGDATWPAGRGPALVFGLDPDGRRVHAERDLESEVKRHRMLRDELGLADEETTRVDDLERSLVLLADLEAQAKKGACTLEWPAKRWKRVGVAGDLRVRVRRAGAWLGVEGEVDVEGKAVPLSALLTAVREGKRFVRVGAGRFATIQDDLRARLEGVSDVLYDTEEGLAAGLAAAAELQKIAENVEGEEWLELLARMNAAEGYDPPLPTDLRADLRGYQRDGFRWLARLSSWGAGACLADEMGLGKTVQALALLVHRQADGPALVVAPTSVGAGWAREAERFAPTLRVIDYRGARREALLEDVGRGDLVLTSYDLLARDDGALANVRFGTIVFDEAQALKNARTQRAKAARRLQGDFRLALTGTPLENHLGELWSLFAIVSPGFLGSWAHFSKRFANPIERDGDTEKRGALGQRLRPFLLRRTKKEVTPELPPRTDVVRPVELSDAERNLYDAIRRDALESLVAPGAGGARAESKRRFDVLAAMTRLRLLACHPRLVDAASSVPSSKLAAFLELIEELRADGHRALVFSQFTSLLRLVRDALDLRGIRSLYLDGSTPVKKRADLVQAWQDGDDPLFLISLKAGGTGLNLTAADTVIHLDPWWNPAVEDQASDRAHRIGQDKPVTVVRLVAQETIEESVLALHGDKRALFQGVLEGTGEAAKLDTQELMALIRGPE
ncbi:MAG: DEAD/DEAH box helicase [Polyangiales bacterium]